MQSTEYFDKSVQQWFEANFDEPTPVQMAAWPIIASGDHALITAPTGSGKTLTAFTWSLSQFANGTWPTGQTKVLYISPLKALNNDIQKNLITPLNALHKDYACPPIRVGTRSGDTSQSERQRLLRAPPDILITTPESLSLMLTTAKGRIALANVATVILDEIHSVIDNRRGVLLMTNIERLASLSGEFQRIALSATVSPLDVVANFIAGYDEQGKTRTVRIVDPPGAKNIEFRVRFPEAAKHAADEGKKIWNPLTDDFRDIIDENRSTLFFTNSRRLAEKITLKINQQQVSPLAYAHHGSLAREIRTEVGTRLKKGELKAIVATNSLEMGIDIGHLDEVVMVQSPPSIAATLQRIGRSGHGVGETSVGTLYPTHAQDFLSAAVLADAIESREIEPLRPMQAPLDVLAQIVISICATEPWVIDDVFGLITRASPYHKLARPQFDLVIEMLAGRYAGSRIRELKARITHDRINQTIQSTRGAILAMYNSGGTIPDRGYYQMRHADTGGVIGELDEEFVWEATIGDNFTLGTQHWQIHRITHNDVMVRAAKPGTAAPPFWRSEFFNRSFHFSNRIAQYLEMQESGIAAGQTDESLAHLVADRGFAETAAQELMDFLNSQREHTQTALPHRHHLLLELVRAGPAGYQGPDDPQQLVMHTYWGGQLNQPYALALRAAWRKKYGQKLDVHADNNAIVLQYKGKIDPHDVVTLVNSENLIDLLRQSLEQSGFFGARFRECAGRSLLLTKQRFNQRLLLWMSRMQAKKLMSQVKKLDNFPVLLETWRTCLDDEFDLPNLYAVLEELQQGVISWSFVTTTTPSPFAQDLTFNQVSRYMYADDTPEDEEVSRLGMDAISEAIHNDALRPTIDASIIEDFLSKRQRTREGYQPEDAENWHEWLKERILIPAAEIPSTLPKLSHGVWLLVDDRSWLTHLELVSGLYGCGHFSGAPPEGTPDIEESRSALQISREILSFYGPLTEVEITDLLPQVDNDLLTVDETFIYGTLKSEVTEQQWCDADNFEILIRMQRTQRRSAFEPLAHIDLPRFWAQLHRLHQDPSPPNAVYALETLRGYPAPVKTWLEDLAAARLNGRTLLELEDVLQTQGMHWQGVDTEQITIAYPEDLDLLRVNQQGDLTEFFADPAASYRFDQIFEQTLETAGIDRQTFNGRWWQEVWSGALTSDSLSPLSQGLLQKFEMPSPTQNTSSRRHMARHPRGWSGLWHLTPQAAAPDPLTALENDKERVRLMLDRYGFLCRELVNRESLKTETGKWRWHDAFRALRIMELSGEVIAGQFFLDLATPQFISPNALSQLQSNTMLKDSFWVATQDPVAPCGLGLPWPDLPHRRSGNYLSFLEGRLALSVTGSGKHLAYDMPWDHPAVDLVNGVLTHMVTNSRQRIVVQDINDMPARQSPFIGPLERLFTVGVDHKSIFLELKR